MTTICTKSRDISTVSLVQTNNLRAHAQWIRDTIDPVIARDGPEAMLVEDALYLDEYLRKLATVSVSVADMRLSRIHLAILDVAGRSTRWPYLLIEQAEAVVKAWEDRVGKLTNVGTELLGPGGRLSSIATAKDLAADTLLMRWLKHSDKVLPTRARRWGDAGFKAGDWWINALFAFRDGMLDSGDPVSGIVSDQHGAYAILMSGDDKIITSTPEMFTYRSHTRDKGRYRLTSASRDSRHPIRILRSHSLRSPWSPRAGIRYDGLYKVTGWSIFQDKPKQTIVYHISFERLKTELPIKTVLDRPTTEEVEDYREYKRIRHTSPPRGGKLAKMGIPEHMLTAEGNLIASALRDTSERGQKK